MSNPSSSPKYSKIYQQIWQLARPYYQRGRPMDIKHIEWMMLTAADVSKQEELDHTLLLPLVILHDVGYSQVEHVDQADYYQQDIRRQHMREGAKIAKQILMKVNYSSEKVTQIVKYISMHDNWALGEIEIYLEDKILGVFKDLDYVWSYTPQGFKSLLETTGKSRQELYEELKKEQSPIYGKKPFSSQLIKDLRSRYLAELENLV